MPSLHVVVEGVDLPGRQCRPGPDGAIYENVHVGVCDRAWPGPPTIEPHRPWGVRGLVRGDAPQARWQFDITMRIAGDDIDFGGPLVRGKRGDRHIGLAWGEVSRDGTFRLFRGAKLRLDAVDSVVIRQASEPGRRLVARLGLTDVKGNPRCATVRPPDVTWSVEPDRGGSELTAPMGSR